MSKYQNGSWLTFILLRDFEKFENSSYRELLVSISSCAGGCRGLNEVKLDRDKERV